MKKFLVVLLFFVYSCSTAPKDYSSNKIIPKDKMIKILVDFYLAEASILSQMQEGNYARDYAQYYYENLFKKYQINREEFLNSLKYYSFDIKQFSQIINATLLELTKIQAAKDPKATSK